MPNRIVPNGTYSFFFSGKKTGMMRTMAITENSMPLITPTAKLNQNELSRPSIRNGISPSTVLRMVSIVGTILRLNALTYVLSPIFPLAADMVLYSDVR